MIWLKFVTVIGMEMAPPGQTLPDPAVVMGAFWPIIIAGSRIPIIAKITLMNLDLFLIQKYLFLG